MDISVITPCFNNAGKIENAIKSVVQQQGVLIEHIVVDDGSSDHLSEIIKRYPEIVFIQQANRGACAARNSGLSVSKGKYIKFLDSDDILEEQVLSREFYWAENCASNELIFGHCRVVSEDSVNVNKKAKYLQIEFLHEIMVSGIMTTMPLYSRSALIEIGGWDERLVDGHEWNLNWRLVKQGYKFVYRPYSSYIYFAHTGSVRISRQKRSLNEIKSLLSYLYEPLKDVTDPRVRDAWALLLWGIGRSQLRKGDLEGAKWLFSESRAFSPKGYKHYMTKSYKAALLLFGPMWADRVYDTLRKILHKIV